MSRYAVDVHDHMLVVSWDTGLGDVAERVARFPTTVDPSDALQLARTLTFLSAAAWRTYTHPEEAALQALPAGGDGLAGRDTEVFGKVIAAIEHPHLPHDGLVRQALVVVEEAAHRVGRALHAIADAALTTQVAADVRAELDAVERAELGELSGRARQAVTLSRADASPLQVAAADTLLRTDPLGSRALFTDVEPTAAAIAAAHWLHAAAIVAAQHADLDVTQVVAEADAIEPLPHRTPTLVLHQVEAGDSPREAVLDLISHAMVVAEGRNPDLDDLLEWVTEIIDGAGGDTDAEGRPSRRMTRPLPPVEGLAIEIRGEPDDGDDEDDDTLSALTDYDENDDEDDDETSETVVLPDRLTPLDPRRPAVDLLEDLLAGIHGCWLLYREFADPPGVSQPPEPAAASLAPTAETISAARRGRREQLRRAFDDEVRAAAATLRDQLV
ncbi:hypothetical protein I6A84_35130 [Frankia sp. CNm7]|uniref:Uncharacterized protein n=1 Tax=Frankia nepalensis TaxID=1836974 RepID=A0A937UR89_9ACTN|nr:hypothetical protein [Frankia nepalensis]MBL7501806.1 hypothetical protein [Frankia nepalensis]MBL7512326.1 hypothetical protein [Frankia nepalensis]MBL7523183.1 hypothetical protein [Frankia nepalensis]MBL7632624.1 hypothetical protein [Frankia nepalensis]